MGRPGRVVVSWTGSFRGTWCRSSSSTDPCSILLPSTPRMSDSDGDFSDELLELAGATEKKRKRREGSSKSEAKRRKAEYVVPPFLLYSVLHCFPHIAPVWTLPQMPMGQKVRKMISRRIPTLSRANISTNTTGNGTQPLSRTAFRAQLTISQVSGNARNRTRGSDCATP